MKSTLLGRIQRCISILKPKTVRIEEANLTISMVIFRLRTLELETGFVYRLRSPGAKLDITVST